jgi:adenine-specific DNA-methyltransferase
VRDGLTIEQLVDLPETFGLLLGLRRETRRVFKDGARRYLVERGRIDHRTVVVIWRSTEGWTKADFESDRRFIEEKRFGDGADELLVNGDSTVPGAKSLDPLFKARLFAPVSVESA